MKFDIPNSMEKIERYNVASLAADTGVITRPKDFPILEGLTVHGATNIKLDLHLDGNSAPNFTLPGYDMAVETDEFTQEADLYIPMNIPMSVGEKIDILGTSLTLAAEISMLARFRTVPSGPQIGIERFTYTNTGTLTDIGSMPTDAKDVVAMLDRGIDAEASEFSIGKVNPSWIRSVMCSALNDIIIAPKFQPILIRQVAGDVVHHHQSHTGTGGDAELLVAYTRK